MTVAVAIGTIFLADGRGRDRNRKIADRGRWSRSERFSQGDRGAIVLSSKRANLQLCPTVPPMQVQRKRWAREDRMRHHQKHDYDDNRPTWLFNLNEPRDIDDERPLWLRNMNDVPQCKTIMSRTLRRARIKHSAKVQRSLKKTLKCHNTGQLVQKCAFSQRCLMNHITCLISCATEFKFISQYKQNVCFSRG